MSPNALRTAHSPVPASRELWVITTQAVTLMPAARSAAAARSNEPAGPGPASAGRSGWPFQRAGSGR